MARNARNQMRQSKQGRGNPRRNQGGAAETDRRSGRVEGKFELDNLTYDLIAALHKKSEALEVYDKYISDAGSSDVAAIFEEIRDDDQRHIQRLQMALRDRLRGAGEEMEEEEEAA
jgi:rubrerythrin